MKEHLGIDEFLASIAGFPRSKRADRWKKWTRKEIKNLEEEGLSDSEINTRLTEYQEKYDKIGDERLDALLDKIKSEFGNVFHIFSHGSRVDINKLKGEILPRRNLRLAYNVSDNKAKQILSNYLPATTGNLEQNLETFIEHIEDLSEKKELATVSTKSFSIDSYLGGLNFKEIYMRDSLYDYWSTVNAAYQELETQHNSLIEKINDEEIPPEAKKALEKIKEMGVPPKWIFQIDVVDREELESAARFYNYVLDLEILYNIDKDIERMKDEGNEEDYGDLAAEMYAEVNKVPQKGEWGDTMLDPKLSSSTDDDDFDADLERFSIDPLLALYMEKNKEKLVAITDRGYNEIEDKLEDWLKESEIPKKAGEDITFGSIVLKDKIMQDVQDIRDTVSVELGRAGTEYWFPYTIAFDLDITENGKSIDADSINNAIELYLRRVSDFLSDETLRFPNFPVFSRGHIGSSIKDLTRDEGMKYQRLTEAQRALGGRISGEGDPTKIPEFAEELRVKIKLFLEALNAYYFRPAYTGRLVGRFPNFVTSNAGKKIQAIAKNFNVRVLHGRVYREMLQTDVSVDSKELKSIYDFLSEATSKGVVDQNKIETLGNGAVDALSEMFGWRERNARHIGAIIYHIINEEDPDSKLKELANIEGEPINELNDKFYENRNVEYPLFALPFYLKENFGLFKDLGSEEEKLAKNLINLFENIEDMPVLLKQLLKAHDAIRKAMGKETNFAMRPMTIDNYEEVIEKIYLNYNVDLAHLEIENIVKEVDSFSNIAKCYGITEEIVYQVKSEFR